MKIFKKSCFWTIFGPFSQLLRQKKVFLENPAVTHNFIWVSSIMPKFWKKLMIQFQENTQTDRRMDGRTDRRMHGRTDGRMDRPYSIGPFWLTLGAQNHLKLVKLHKQFGNASPTNLRNLLKIAGLFSAEISELINEVCDNSIVCKT